MSKKTSIIISIIVLIIIGGGFFYGGMIYGKGQKATSSTASSFLGLRGSRSGGATTVSGNILSNDGSSIILQLPSNVGGSDIVFYSNATQISKFASDTPADLKVGEQVSVTGTATKGGITAQSIQVRPARTAAVTPAAGQ